MTTSINESRMAVAVKMVILDAIEKGHTKPNELTQYMASVTFEQAVKNYYQMFLSI